MTTLLRTEKLTKRFGPVVANKNVDLKIYPSEIHCLFGENGAGKSTLAECLYGYYKPDSGSIYIREQRVNLRSPRDAIDHGIGMVHQHFVLIPSHSVLENIILGTDCGRVMIDTRTAEAKLHDLCRAYELDIHLHTEVRDLAVGQQQWVEILKTLYLGAEVLILDEPTAVLTPQESKRLFEVMESMTKRGLSIVLITHKLSEVMQSDWVTVLRKGEVVQTVQTAKTSAEALTTMMVGRTVALSVQKEALEPGTPVLEISRLEATDDRGVPSLREVSLQVGRHEILGIAGVAGNGQKELFEILAGVRRATSGKVRLLGEDITNLEPADMIKRGVGHIPDDRFREGLVSGLSIAENLILGQHRDREFLMGPLFNWEKVDKYAREKREKFAIDTPSVNLPVRNLSGGNAQRVILAREFQQCTTLLLANQPTRGLDVGVIEYVYKELLCQRRDGLAILLASEDLEDLFSLSDRLVVFFKGRVMGELIPAHSSFEEVGYLMAGQSDWGQSRGVV